MQTFGTVWCASASQMLSFNRALDYNRSLDDFDEDDTIDPSFMQDYGGATSASDGFGRRIIPESPFLQEPCNRQQMAAGGTSIHQMLDNYGIHLENPPSSQPPQQKQSVISLYPHISRQFNEDFDSCVQINWEKCTSKQIYDICTSPHLQCGASKSMAWMLQHAVKQLTGTLSCFCVKVRSLITLTPLFLS